MIPGTTFVQPPRLKNDEGEERRVGVELEFAALSANEGATLVRDLFGGEVRMEDPHRYLIEGTELGDFVCELDSRLAHKNKDAAPARNSFDKFLDDLGEELRRLYGDVSAGLVPCEIVCPPIPLTALPRVDELVEKLRHAGAAGTDESPLFAFGAQLNPEIATTDPEWICAMMKAYALLSDWLREVTEIDATRRLASFADPFPQDYVAKLVHPDYQPSTSQLIDDYLADNPTRNREVDMLPLFLWLDEDRVRRKLPHEKIHARPTFHYRLPNADLGRQGWNVSVEWNRWRMVERLAAEPERLAAMGRAWAENADRILPANWAILSSEWMLLE